jgi:hypothetical protein
VSTLYITEYYDIFGHAQVPLEPPVAKQTVAIGASSAQSAAFSPQTRIIRIHTDSVCSVSIGVGPTGPTATATDARMAANQTEYRGVSPGQILAVITNS